MTLVAFDALRFVQTLRTRAHMSQEQAEGIAEAFAQATTDQLATKIDIAHLQAQIRETELRLEKLMLEHFIKTGAMLFALGGVLIAVRFFAH